MSEIGLYRLINHTEITPQCFTVLNESDLWHRRLAHTPLDAIKRMISNQQCSGIKITGKSDHGACTECLLSKQKRSPFKSRTTKAISPFDLVFTDVHGPLEVASLGGSRYILTFIDDATHFTWAYFMKAKSDVTGYMKRFITLIQTQFDKTVKAFRADGGTEYNTNEILDFLKDNGIVFQRTTPASPQSNGVSERFNQTLLNMTRSLLFDSGLPKSFWAEAAAYSVYIRNRIPTSSNPDSMSPYQSLFGTVPDMSSIRLFGCKAYGKVTAYTKDLEKRSIPSYFVGIDPNSQGFKLMSEQDRNIYLSRDVYFDETIVYKTQYPDKQVTFQIDLESDRTRNRRRKPKYKNSKLVDSVHPRKLVPAPQVALPNQLSLDLNTQTETSDVSFRTADENLSETDQAVPPHPVLPLIDSSQDSLVADPPESIPSVSSDPSPMDSSTLPTGNTTRSSSDNTGSTSTSSKPVQDDTSPKEPPIFLSKIPRLVLRQRSGSDYKAEPYKTKSGRTVKPVTRANYTSYVALVVEPRSYKEAMASPNKDRWLSAMQDEYASLLQNATWELVPLPPGRKAIKSRWVFTVKYNDDNTIDRFKARLVAKGFSQVPGLDYSDTYSPVAKFNSLRMLIALAAILDLELFQIDVKTAFLNGTLEEVIFMSQPEGFSFPGQEHLVCRLLRSLYGLKQSPRRWNIRFNDVLLKNGYKRILHDPCVYVKRTVTAVSFVLIYVDDGIIASNVLSEVRSMLASLKSEFEITEKGDLKYILGMQVVRNRQRKLIALHQETYIRNMVDDFNVTALPPATTPLPSPFNPPKHTTPQANMEDKPFRSLIGKLNYAMVGTRPDIAYAISKLSRDLQFPGVDHWNAALQVLRYLKGTSSYGLIFDGSSSPLTPVGFADAAYQEDSIDLKSRNGYVFLLANSSICWRSHKQSNTSTSSMESEFIGLYDAANDAAWIRGMLNQLGMSLSNPITIYGDNQSSLATANDVGIDGRSKHILTKYFYIREQVENLNLQLEFIPGKEMVADILTKSLSKRLFQKCRDGLGVRSYHTITSDIQSSDSQLPNAGEC
jgi:transposase InsO family protein